MEEAKKTAEDSAKAVFAAPAGADVLAEEENADEYETEAEPVPEQDEGEEAEALKPVEIITNKDEMTEMASTPVNVDELTTQLTTGLSVANGGADVVGATDDSL